jgi:hypothetical protein
MKKITQVIILMLLVVTTMSSCQEENIQPSSEPLKTKEGNIVGVDDWEKHNV